LWADGIVILHLACERIVKSRCSETIQHWYYCIFIFLNICRMENQQMRGEYQVRWKVQALFSWAVQSTTLVESRRKQSQKSALVRKLLFLVLIIHLYKWRRAHHSAWQRIHAGSCVLGSSIFVVSDIIVSLKLYI
jgi:hypothetical protein